MNQSVNNLAKLFRQGRELAYERNEVIIRAGDMPSGIYFMTNGWAKVYTLCRDGEQNILTTLYPGDIFPLAWAITGIDHDVTIAALVPSVVKRLRREEFIVALGADSAASESALAMLSRYFFRLCNELENLHYCTARERIAFRLLSPAAHFGSRHDGSTVLSVKIPNEFIARSTNMTRETASREMSRLSQKGLIAYHGDYIAVSDLAALAKEAGSTLPRSKPARLSRLHFSG